MSCGRLSVTHTDAVRTHTLEEPADVALSAYAGTWRSSLMYKRYAQGLVAAAAEVGVDICRSPWIAGDIETGWNCPTDRAAEISAITGVPTVILVAAYNGSLMGELPSECRVLANQRAPEL